MTTSYALHPVHSHCEVRSQSRSRNPAKISRWGGSEKEVLELPGGTRQGDDPQCGTMILLPSHRPSVEAGETPVSRRTPWGQPEGNAGGRQVEKSTSDSHGAGPAPSRCDDFPSQPGTPGANRAVDILRISRFHPLGEVCAFTALRLSFPAGEPPTYPPCIKIP